MIIKELISYHGGDEGEEEQDTDIPNKQNHQKIATMRPEQLL